MNPACSQAGDHTEAFDTANEAAQQWNVGLERLIASLSDAHRTLHSARALAQQRRAEQVGQRGMLKNEHVDWGGSEDRSGTRLAAASAEGSDMECDHVCQQGLMLRAFALLEILGLQKARSSELDPHGL